jgi:hypothetical protein
MRRRFYLQQKVRQYLERKAGRLAFQGVTPPQSRETTVVSIRRNPLATGFDRQSCKIGVGNQIASYTSGSAQVSKDIPVSRPGSDQDRVWPLPNCLDKSQAGCQLTGRVEDSRMGHDAKETAQHEIRQAGGD